VTERVAWVQMGWFEPFFWRWFLLRMATMMVPALLCFHWGAGVIGLACFTLGALPWPTRVTVDASGVTVASFLARASWPAATIERIYFQLDPRRLVWPRYATLVVERPGRPPARIFGSTAQLTALAQTAEELGLGAKQPPAATLEV